MLGTFYTVKLVHSTIYGE